MGILHFTCMVKPENQYFSSFKKSADAGQRFFFVSTLEVIQPATFKHNLNFSFVSEIFFLKKKD